MQAVGQHTPGLPPVAASTGSRAGGEAGPARLRHRSPGAAVGPAAAGEPGVGRWSARRARSAPSATQGRPQACAAPVAPGRRPAPAPRRAARSGQHRRKPPSRLPIATAGAASAPTNDRGRPEEGQREQRQRSNPPHEQRSGGAQAISDHGDHQQQRAADAVRQPRRCRGRLSSSDLGRPTLLQFATGPAVAGGSRHSQSGWTGAGTPTARHREHQRGAHTGARRCRCRGGADRYGSCRRHDADQWRRHLAATPLLLQSPDHLRQS